jgi:hypothetical protein
MKNNPLEDKKPHHLYDINELGQMLLIGDHVQFPRVFLTLVNEICTIKALLSRLSDIVHEVND